jgi:hypothetical protein
MRSVCSAPLVHRQVALDAASRKQSVMDDATSSFAWIGRTREPLHSESSSIMRATLLNESERLSRNASVALCRPQFCILRALCAAEFPCLHLFVRKRAM